MSKSARIIDQIFDIHQETKNSVLKEKNNFSYLDADTQIKGLSWYLPESESERTRQMFFRLKEYFEVGFYFKKLNKDLWSIENGFIFNKFAQSEDIKNNLVQLPDFMTFKVYKNNTGQILKLLGLEALEDKDFTTVIYKVDHETIYCFLTKQADPWLSLRLEKILKEIRNGLA
jgi:hypothetical protein